MIIRNEREPIKLIDQNEASIRVNVYFRDENFVWYYKEIILSKRGLIKVGGRKDKRFAKETSIHTKQPDQGSVENVMAEVS